MAGEYVLTYRSEDGSVEVRNLDGVSWYEAPLPSRWHRCRAQTKGLTNYFTQVQRCACGAIRMDSYRRWLDRNSRRK